MGLGIGRLTRAQSWEDLKPRLISAVILGLAVLGLAIAGGTLFRLLCVATGYIVFDEWARITGAKRAGPLFYLARRALVLSLLAFLFHFELAAILIVAVVALFIAFVDRREKRANWVAGGLLYAGVAGLAPGMLRGDDVEGLIALGLVICVVWSTDIFAYFSGRMFGGPKLMPLVSPKKTISGAVGGLLAGMVAGGVYAHFLMHGASFGLLLMAGVLSIVGQAGDLYESWIKRRFGVKDSGKLIPGHGGLMDRIDALVIATGVLWLIGLAGRGLEDPAFAIFHL
ncbi:phosphatidate cytidylyltransferase [Aureimonas fodinaquatilis]|uniref:Phosphatidate cytidylyltransferase n=1 Tax=Aureimonas fodinaquatilis TaxID=2565783 RepID=A0A5B0E0F1_9HYPH|nr:phosphatidate cytidylyltransferase [Aureimonas fodinaquatilis]KAA0971230.1 phosphatidate cytidylyltransferase [Aureimonas fodinaquatilis]